MAPGFLLLYAFVLDVGEKVRGWRYGMSVAAIYGTGSWIVMGIGNCWPCYLPINSLIVARRYSSASKCLLRSVTCYSADSASLICMQNFLCSRSYSASSISSLLSSLCSATTR